MESVSISALRVYTSFMPLHESPLSEHYTRYSNTTVRVEHVSQKPHVAFIKIVTTVSSRTLQYHSCQMDLIYNLGQ